MRGDCLIGYPGRKFVIYIQIPRQGATTRYIWVTLAGHEMADFELRDSQQPAPNLACCPDTCHPLMPEWCCETTETLHSSPLLSDFLYWSPRPETVTTNITLPFFRELIQLAYQFRHAQAAQYGSTLQTNPQYLATSLTQCTNILAIDAEEPDCLLVQHCYQSPSSIVILTNHSESSWIQVKFYGYHKWHYGYFQRSTGHIFPSPSPHQVPNSLLQTWQSFRNRFPVDHFDDLDPDFTDISPVPIDSAILASLLN